MYELVLVSQSPRRKQLLEEAGFIFRTGIVKVSEFIEENLNLGAAIEDVAETKAAAWVDINKHLKSQEILVLSADTIVAFEGNILGKPVDRAEARKTLGLLSAKTHSVITAFCLWNLGSGRICKRHHSTEVQFNTLATSEIEAYVASGKPLDKAGSYGIQEVGERFVKSIKGSYSSVVGLPMELFEKTLAEEGLSVARK